MDVLGYTPTISGGVSYVKERYDKILDEYIINRNKILCKHIDFVKINYKLYNNYMNRILELLKTQGITNIIYTGKKDFDNDKYSRKLKIYIILKNILSMNMKILIKKFL